MAPGSGGSNEEGEVVRAVEQHAGREEQGEVVGAVEQHAGREEEGEVVRAVSSTPAERRRWHAQRVWSGWMFLVGPISLDCALALAAWC